MAHREFTNPNSEHRIRQRLVEAAIEVLSGAPYDDSLLDLVSKRAGYSSRKVATFFGNSGDILLALYSRFASDLESRVDELPECKLADRFTALMLLKFELMAPYRHALHGLEAVLSGKNGQPGVLSPETEQVRRRVQAVMAETVAGATDHDKADSEIMVRNLYSAYLAIMWLWFRDPSGRRAERLLKAVAGGMSFSVSRMSRPAVSLPLKALGVFQSFFVQKDHEAETKAAEILRIIFEHRRLLPDAGACREEPCERCLGPHIPKAAYFVSANRPLHVILPAFPAKSPNRTKTLGSMPDMAEEQALVYLASIYESVKRVYPPGVRLTICSDGHVFSDLVGVSDENVSRYGAGIENMIERLGLDDTIDTFSLRDLYEDVDLPEMRRHLNQHYEMSLEALRDRSSRSPQAASLVNGIQRFLFEDKIAMDEGRSRTQVRNECRSLAYKVVQRSDGWGRLLSDCFPMALRLSIHPQAPHSDKIGILLGMSDDVWLTPWHSVAAKKDGRFVLMKRHEAEGRGGRVSVDGNYYEL